MEKMKFAIISSLVAMTNIGECDDAYAYQCMSALLNESSEHYEAFQLALARPGINAEVFMAHVIRSQREGA